MSRVSTPGHFWLLLAVGVACLLTLDFVLAPDWLAADQEALPDAGPRVVAEPTAVPSAAPPRSGIPAAARVPTIVARFGNESKEPSDDSGIKALFSAMIEDHDARIVLEGHSDTIGSDDANHELSLARANLVRDRLVVMGISPERIETVGLGGTRPLHSDMPDASSVNRRVEVRWVGRGFDAGSYRRAPSAVVTAAAPVFADAAAPVRPSVGALASDAGVSLALDLDAGPPKVTTTASAAPVSTDAGPRHADGE
jgi:outer membrane protein OmpA-like peptidoglycan-associated protein